MIDLESVEKILKDMNLKLTKQRKAIIEVLLENEGSLLSAEQIYEKNKDKCPDTNLSTVYRNLEILENAKIVHRTNINGNTSCYELVCGSLHHHYLICKECGKTETIDFCPFENLKPVLGDDFMVTDHKIELYGYCKNCRKKKK